MTTHSSVTNGDVREEHSLDESRTELLARLRLRRAEIERALYTRIQDAVPEAFGDKDPEYEAGLRAAVAALVSYSLDALEFGPAWLGAVPVAAAIQARRAARRGVSLGTVMRRYVAANGRFGEFVAEEAERTGLESFGPVVQHLRRTQELLLEHVTAAIQHEYHQAQEDAAPPPQRRRAEIVQRLIVGELVDPAALAELEYDLYGSWHIGLVAAGPMAEDALECLTDRRPLLVTCTEGAVWGWLAARHRTAARDIEGLLSNKRVPGVVFGIGEPGAGIEGWRLTHHQAQRALTIALRKPNKLALYAEGPLLAAALQSETLARSLNEMYLAPLASQRDGGVALRRTVRAYLDAECNASSAAAALSIGRHAVESRIRLVEELIGCPLRLCVAGLDVALRLAALDAEDATS